MLDIGFIWPLSVYPLMRSRSWPRICRLGAGHTLVGALPWAYRSVTEYIALAMCGSDCAIVWCVEWRVSGAVLWAAMSIQVFRDRTSVSGFIVRRQVRVCWYRGDLRCPFASST